MKLTAKKALIAGGNSGIGLATRKPEQWNKETSPDWVTRLIASRIKRSPNLSA